MKVKALQMSDLLKGCDDIYTTSMIIAQRTRQIIDDRVVEIDEVEDFEDTIQFSEPVLKKDESEKPMVQALEEYLNDELEWRAPDEDDVESSDETKL